MARRISYKESEAIVWLIILCIPFFLLIGLVKVIGLPISIILAGIIIFGVIKYIQKKRKERIMYLTKKYNNSEIVDKIMNKSFWKGQTAEQLNDSLGKPLDIDEKVLKTKKKEIWKYNRDGKNRYRLRITLENNKVKGWTQR